MTGPKPQNVLPAPCMPVLPDTSSTASTSDVHPTEPFLEQESYLSAILENFPGLIWLKDRDSRFLTVNKAFARACFHTGPSDVAGKTDFDVWPAELAERYRADDREVMNSRASCCVEEPITKEGGYGWLETYKTPVFDAQGEVIGTVGFARDITERKREEDILQARLLLTEYAPTHTLDDLIAKVLEEAEMLTGSAISFFHFVHQNQKNITMQYWSPQTHLSMTLSDSKQQGISLDQAGVWADCIRTRRPVIHNDYQGLAEKSGLPEGHLPLERELVVPVFRGNNIVATLGVGNKKSPYGTADMDTVITLADFAWDIIQAKQAEEQVREARIVAEQANAAKSEFLANMSHEIRTPINAVIGLSALLGSTALDGEQQEYVEMISDSSKNLLEIINDILDFSKIEARKQDLEISGFNLYELMESLLEMFTPLVREKRLVLDYVLDPEVPALLRGDSRRIRQVIINLVGNAIKFTSQGGVTLRLSKEAECEGGLILRVSVADTGIGIPLDRCDAVFSPFVQADGSTSRCYGGTGLGLSISRQLVELMGGELNLKSTEGTGTTFWFTVPLEYQLDADEALDAGSSRSVVFSSSAVPATDAYRVLVVEDNPINQRVTKVTLNKLGYLADIALNGREAIAALCKNDYDLVLMDCQMPEMDGYETTRLIRSPDSGVLRHDIPIIAITAHALHENREKCRNAGMNDFLAKPIQPVFLAGMLEKWLPPKQLPVISESLDALDSEQLQSDEIFDEADFMRRNLYDNELAHVVTELFAEHAPGYIAELQDAFTRQDFSGLQHYAHTLKGASATTGAVRIAGLAQQLEQKGKEGTLEGVAELLAELDAEYVSIVKLFLEKGWVAAT